MRSRSLATPPEEAFAFHVPLAVPFFSNFWTAGTRREVPDLRLGDAQLVDLATNRRSVWTFLSIRFAFISLKLRSMRWPTKLEFAEWRDYVRRILVAAIWSCSAWRKRSLARWSGPARHRHVFRLYRASFLRSRRARLRQSVGRWAKHPWLPCAVAAAARLRLHHRQPGDDPSMAEVANECRLSSSYFARAFKQTTGVPPFRWLTNQRVVRAKELLQDPWRELADIAQLCGFVDQSHFTRVFSKSEGHSPGRWRRLYRL